MPAGVTRFPPSETWVEESYDYAHFEGGGRGRYRDYWTDEALHFANAGARGEQARCFGAAAPGVWLDVGCAAECTLVEERNTGVRCLRCRCQPMGVWLFDRRSIDAVLTRSGFHRPAILAIAKALSAGWACGLPADRLSEALLPMLSRIAP